MAKEYYSTGTSNVVLVEKRGTGESYLNIDTIEAYIYIILQNIDWLPIYLFMTLKLEKLYSPIRLDLITTLINTLFIALIYLLAYGKDRLMLKEIQ